MPNELEIITPAFLNKYSEPDLIDKVAEFKKKGLGYSEIARAMNIPKELVMKYYHIWVQEHKEDLFESKMAIMVETNQMYPKIIADADLQYEIAKAGKKSVEMAGWLRVKLEALREYREYLKSIGFINEALSQQYEQNNSKETTDPILDLINANKVKLAEAMKKKEENHGQTDSVGTVGQANP